MEPITLATIIILGIICLYQFGQRLTIESIHNTRTSELEAVLASIVQASKGGDLTVIRPTDGLVRAIFAEYLKIYLQQRLDKRVAALRNRVHVPGTKDEVYTVSSVDLDEVPATPQILPDKSVKRFIKHSTGV